MIRDNLLIEDILDSVLLEESRPTYAALAKWCKRYPEHCEALATFFATWAIQADLLETTVVDEDRLAGLAVSHALNLLHGRDEQARKSMSTEGAHPRLLASARACGISQKDLADKVGLDTTVIHKLDLRRLTMVPVICFERLATAMGTTIDRVVGMIAGPAIVPSGARYKSRARPKPSTEDFVDAIRASLLSEDMKRFWLDAAAGSAGDRE